MAGMRLLGQRYVSIPIVGNCEWTSTKSVPGLIKPIKVQGLLRTCGTLRLSETDLLSSAVGGDIGLAGLGNPVVEAVVLLHALPALLHLRAAGLPKVWLRQ